MRKIHDQLIAEVEVTKQRSLFDREEILLDLSTLECTLGLVHFHPISVSIDDTEYLYIRYSYLIFFSLIYHTALRITMCYYAITMQCNIYHNLSYTMQVLLYTILYHALPCATMQVL